MKIVCYFRWRLELVSNILLLIVGFAIKILGFSKGCDECILRRWMFFNWPYISSLKALFCIVTIWLNLVAQFFNLNFVLHQKFYMKSSVSYFQIYWLTWSQEMRPNFKIRVKILLTCILWSTESNLEIVGTKILLQEVDQELCEWSRICQVLIPTHYPLTCEPTLFPTKNSPK